MKRKRNLNVVFKMVDKTNRGHGQIKQNLQTWESNWTQIKVVLTDPHEDVRSEISNESANQCETSKGAPPETIQFFFV